MSVLSKGQLLDLSAEILEVDKDASVEEITSAYRDKTFLYHPDQGSEPDKDKFKAIDKARDGLSEDEYFEDKSNRRSATNVFTQAFGDEFDIDETVDVGGSEVSTGQEQRNIAVEFAVSVLVDMAFSELDEIFKVPTESPEFSTTLTSQILSDGYAPQTFDTITNGTLAEMAGPMLIEDVSKEELEEYLDEIDSQIVQEYGHGTDMTSVAKLVGILITSGIIRPEDLGEEQDTGPWEYPSDKSSGAWTRDRQDSGPWSR